VSLLVWLAFGGCGTGYLLRLLARQWPQASELAGIDLAPSMIEATAGSARDECLRFSIGAAERLPYPDSSFDLVVSTTSFDHWSGQQAGLRECARALMPGGHLMLVDLFSHWLIPTLIGGRRERREPGDEPTSCSAPEASSRSPGTTSTPSSSRP